MGLSFPEDLFERLGGRIAADDMREPEVR